MYPFLPPPPPRQHFSMGVWVLIGVALLLVLLTIGALLREAREARSTTHVWVLRSLSEW